MDRIPVQSSNVASVGYDEMSATLEVGFNDGSVYQYFGVPPDVYEGLMNTSSKGSFLNHYVKKGGYSYTKVG